MGVLIKVKANGTRPEPGGSEVDWAEQELWNHTDLHAYTDSTITRESQVSLL